MIKEENLENKERNNTTRTSTGEKQSQGYCLACKPEMHREISRHKDHCQCKVMNLLGEWPGLKRYTKGYRRVDELQMCGIVVNKEVIMLKA